MNLITWISILLVASLFGCASEPKYIRGYQGDALPASKVAFIKPVAFVKIHQIDSMDGLYIDPSGGFSTTEYEIELTAGAHSLEGCDLNKM